MGGDKKTLSYWFGIYHDTNKTEGYDVWVGIYNYTIKQDIPYLTYSEYVIIYFVGQKNIFPVIGVIFSWFSIARQKYPEPILFWIETSDSNDKIISSFLKIFMFLEEKW